LFDGRERERERWREMGIRERRENGKIRNKCEEFVKVKKEKEKEKFGLINQISGYDS
jgi:hypothetical protein